MIECFFKHKQKPSYLDRIDELEKLSIVRFKGQITRDTIPTIESQIKEIRTGKAKIDKNLLLDFSQVDDVDSATIAFHLIHLKEFHEKGFEIGLIHINEEMQALLDLFKENRVFKVFPSEAEAIKVLNT